MAWTFVFADRRHLAPLHRRDAPVGEKDGDVDAAEAPESLDGGPAGVAGGRPDDGGPLAAFRQNMIHEPGEELHRHVLEGERRPVKELQQEMVRSDLDERGYSRMAEARVGFLQHAPKRRLGDLAAREAADDTERRLGVAQPGEGADLPGRELRPDFRDIEPAVAGEAGQHDIAETEAWRFAAGRNITQRNWLRRMKGRRL